MTISKKTCEHCRWFRALKDDAGWGECWVLPPTYPNNKRCQVAIGDECSLFKLRNPKARAVERPL